MEFEREKKEWSKERAASAKVKEVAALKKRKEIESSEKEKRQDEKSQHRQWAQFLNFNVHAQFSPAQHNPVCAHHSTKRWIRMSMSGRASLVHETINTLLFTLPWLTRIHSAKM